MSTGGWTEVIQILKRSEKLLQDTLLCDEKSVADALVVELKYNKSANSACSRLKTGNIPGHSKIILVKFYSLESIMTNIMSANRTAASSKN